MRFVSNENLCENPVRDTSQQNPCAPEVSSLQTQTPALFKGLGFSSLVLLT